MHLVLAVWALVSMSATAPLTEFEPEFVRSPNSTAQLRAFESDAQELAWSARVNAGKSWGVLLPILRDAFTPPRDMQAYRQLVCRNEFTTMRDSCIRTWKDEICTPDMVSEWWSESRSEMRFPNGSIVKFVGLDKPERVLGSRWHRIVVDQAEQIDIHQFNILLTRAIEQIVVVFNPEDPEHWAFKRWKFDEGPRIYTDENGQKVEVIVSSDADNKENESPAYQRRLDSLPGVYGLRLRHGQWISHAGAVYGSVWRGAVDRPETWAEWGGFPPPDWVRVRGMDFGFQNPHATGWFAIDNDDRWWLYRQLYRAEMDPNDIIEMMHRAESEECDAMLNAVKVREERGEWAAKTHSEAAEKAERLARLKTRVATFETYDALSDPARPDLIRTFDNRGLWSRGWDNAVYDGIMSVMMALNPDQPGGPRLFVVKDSLWEPCPILASREGQPPLSVEGEFPVYHWRKEQTGDVAQGPRDAPVKRHDHMLDVIRGCYHTHALYAKRGA